MTQEEIIRYFSSYEVESGKYGTKDLLEQYSALKNKSIIEWLDKEIEYCQEKQNKSAKGGNDHLCWYNRLIAYGKVKEKFLTLTHPPTQ